MSKHAASLFVLLFAVSTHAQQNIVYNNTPSTLIRHGESPWCMPGMKSQQIFEGSLFTTPGSPVWIRDLLAQGHSYDLVATYEDIEIRMGITTVKPNAMVRTFATNCPNPTKLVYRGPLTINFKANTWSGIGLPNAYYFWPMTADENLCMEVIVHSARTMPLSGSRYFYHSKAGNFYSVIARDWLSNGRPTFGDRTNFGTGLGFLLNNGNFVVAGEGGVTSAPYKRVKISASTYPQPGLPITISVDGAGNRSTILAFGFQFAPFDMKVIGAPRSNIWFPPYLSFGMMTDATGKASLPATIPATVTSGTLYCQWYQIDPGAYGNSLGLTTSNCGIFIFGF